MTDYLRSPKLSAAEKEHDKEIRFRVSVLRALVAQRAQREQEWEAAKTKWENEQEQYWPQHPKYGQLQSEFDSAANRKHEVLLAAIELRQLEATEQRALGQPWLYANDAERNRRILAKIESFELAIAHEKRCLTTPFEPV